MIQTLVSFLAIPLAQAVRYNEGQDDKPAKAPTALVKVNSSDVRGAIKATGEMTEGSEVRGYIFVCDKDIRLVAFSLDVGKAKLEAETTISSPDEWSFQAKLDVHCNKQRTGSCRFHGTQKMRRRTTVKSPSAAEVPQKNDR